MRLLIITRYAWDDSIASGNTLSNLFSGWPDTTIYTVYCRDAKPHNNCCIHYYSVSPINIIKNILTPWKIGNKFNIDSSNTVNIANNRTEQALTRMSKKSKYFAYLYDLIYSTRIWLNKRLKDYIKNTEPDLIFCFGVTDAFNYYLVKYIKDNYSIPIVSYFVDDHYKECVKFWNIRKIIHNQRLKKLAVLSNKRYAISQMMCDEYSRLMNLDFSLLTKSVVPKEVKQLFNNPIRITYAGNLFYGRDKTLSSLASAISRINNISEVKFHLDIYTASRLREKAFSCLNQDGVSCVHPPKTYDEIELILNESDIVLHVESFEKSQTKVVRLSFSTKITDCLQSGSMVMAIGPQELASIDFLKKVPGALVISNLDLIEPVLYNLTSNFSIIKQNAMATHVFAKNTMSKDIIINGLINDLTYLLKK